jgi:hypothetical protein
MQIVKIDAKLQWNLTQDKKSARWVAACAPLRIVVEADRIEQLREVIADTLDAVFRDLLLSGELERFLREHGWATSLPIAQIVADQNMRFEVPMPLLEKGSQLGRNGFARAVSQ